MADTFGMTTTNTVEEIKRRIEVLQNYDCSFGRYLEIKNEIETLKQILKTL